MSDFKVKMHQLRFSLELRPSAPRPLWVRAVPDSLAVFKGPTSEGRNAEM